MLGLFFTIVFISELIIASWVISHLRMWNKAVCNANIKVLAIKPKICKILVKFKTSVELITTGYDKAVLFVVNQKSNMINIIVKNLVTVILVFLLKVPARKAIVFFDVISILLKIFEKNTIKKVCS